MRIRAGNLFVAALLAAASLVSNNLQAQTPPPGAYPVQQAGGPAAGPFVPGGPGGNLVDAYGNPAIVPASYCGPGGPCYGGGGYGSAGYGPAYGQVPDLFGGAGLNVEQQGPHYFDISGEFIYWRRDNLGGAGPIAFTADGASNNPTDQNIVLTSDSLGTDFEPGFRLVGRYDIGPLSVLELGYTGLLNQSTGASVTASLPGTVDAGGGVSPFGGNLFSPFTNFGSGFLDEAETIANPFAGGIFADDLENFEETDRALSHRLSFESDFQTAELSYRRYWVGYSPRLTGTLLVGFRYARLEELFAFTSIGADFAPGTPNPPPAAPLGPSSATFSVDTTNNLAGFQLGADASLAVRQGIRINTEGKVGLYNNDISVTTDFITSDGTPPIAGETFNESQVAFLTDFRSTLIIDVLPSVSLKAGYEVLWINSVATAVDNINFSGIAPGSTRVAALDDQGDVLYHGAHFGLEWVW